MMRTIKCFGFAAGVVLAALWCQPVAKAQPPVVVTAYYPPQPVVTYYPVRYGLFGRRIAYRPAVSYAAPVVAHQAYYAPAVPVTTYYAPVRRAMYFAPAPVYWVP
jgi:hypothetical protein